MTYIQQYLHTVVLPCDSGEEERFGDLYANARPSDATTVATRLIEHIYIYSHVGICKALCNLRAVDVYIYYTRTPSNKWTREEMGKRTSSKLTSPRCHHSTLCVIVYHIL